jgi:hypothetical protein
MKKIWLPALILAVCVFAASAMAQAPTYVGGQKCQICHKTEKQGQQYPLWEKSNHAKSFAALTSPSAAANAQALGVKDPATDAKCLKCHAPLADKVAELKAEGVSCEVCHGAGSAYKSLNVMKNKDEAVKAGLKLYANPDAIKAQCLTCHENAHGKSFDFAAAWAKIKHDIPAK